jgi:hypothetical protein
MGNKWCASLSWSTLSKVYRQVKVQPPLLPLLSEAAKQGRSATGERTRQRFVALLPAEGLISMATSCAERGTKVRGDRK